MADGYVGDAVAALKGGEQVYVSPEVGGASELAATLQREVAGSSIGVAVFSDNAAYEATGTEIVTRLAEGSTYDTIIVAVGDDLTAGSRALNSGEALRIANESEIPGDPEAALVATISAVEAATAPAGVPVVGIVTGVGAVLVVAALVTALVVVLRRRGRRRADGAVLEVPRSIEARVGALRRVRDDYGRDGRPDAVEVARTIEGVAENTHQLFTRLGRRGDESELRLAEVEYDDKLKKLTAALAPDYLLDIMRKPELWDAPADRVAEVRTALDAVGEELVENIKQVNARRGLHFQVSLDSVIGRRKELSDWDREFNEQGGTTP